MTTDARVEPYEMVLFKATIRLSAATDICYILAQDVEDALEKIREAYEDMNVLYITSLERLAGTVYISEEARRALQKAFP